MFRVTCAAAAILALSACASGPVSEGSSYTIPRNSTFTLNQDVTIPVGWSRVFVQYGKVTPPGSVNQFEPYCQIEQIELSRQGEAPQVIEADEFRTGKFVRWFMEARQGGALFAGGGTTFRDGGHSNRTFATQVWLHSPRQPQVRRLICGFWGDPALERHLTVAQIREVLGDLASVSIAGGS